MTCVMNVYDICHNPARTVLRMQAARYNSGMERFTDTLIVGACCSMTLLFAAPSTETIVGALLAIVATALYEALRTRHRMLIAAPLAFAASTIAFPAFAAFLPLAAYDCLREEQQLWRFVWIAALPFALYHLPTTGIVALCLSCALACLLSLRTTTLHRERRNFRSMRDNLQEATLAVEAMNRDLQESQDMQVKLATLTERGRIAREIHDNVGHLLTRAIMQVEAMQVVHADDPRTKADFNQVGTTLHEAMDEVRASVHDLRDESVDVQDQMEDALHGCGIDNAQLDYQIENLPANVGYCFLAITREALSNAVRHSDASTIRVDAVEHPGIFQLSICDNGTLRPMKAGGSGMGLPTMEARVRALGGTFRTEYRSGFHVFASIPKIDTAEHNEHAGDPVEKKALL